MWVYGGRLELIRCCIESAFQFPSSIHCVCNRLSAYLNWFCGWHLTTWIKLCACVLCVPSKVTFDAASAAWEATWEGSSLLQIWPRCYQSSLERRPEIEEEPERNKTAQRVGGQKTTRWWGMLLQAKMGGNTCCTGNECKVIVYVNIEHNVNKKWCL